LGRTGVSLPLQEVLQFKMAHAHARDAVFSLLNIDSLIQQLAALQLPAIALTSCATDKHIYLQRPDLGRRLRPSSQQYLSSLKNDKCDIAVVLADGLSAEAINQHAVPVITSLFAKFGVHSWRTAPVCLVEGGRVAIGDEIGSVLQARLSLVLIGERPGLSSPNSMSAYLTYAPQMGLTDERRNCVSNIRPEGLGYEEAAEKMYYLISEAFRLQLSGVGLKDNTVVGLPINAD
jgi:ethanolamine ammonia-lyase small subunit